MQSIRHSTFDDPLTGIPDQHLLINRLSIALARTARSNGVVAVLSCDLDEFNMVNDRVGRDGGDRVLVEVAHRLRRVLGNFNTIARIGGDEFFVVCEGLRTLEDGKTIAASIHDAIEPVIVVDDFEATITVSIGIATVSGYEARDADPIVLVCNADSAMCRAKRGGGGRSEVFDERLVTATTKLPEPDLERRRGFRKDECSSAGSRFGDRTFAA